jgi:hypothetical protein
VVLDFQGARKFILKNSICLKSLMLILPLAYFGLFKFVQNGFELAYNFLGISRRLEAAVTTLKTFDLADPLCQQE